jgi:hypothetical protein
VLRSQQQGLVEFDRYAGDVGSRLEIGWCAKSLKKRKSQRRASKCRQYVKAGEFQVKAINHWRMLVL